MPSLKYIFHILQFKMERVEDVCLKLCETELRYYNNNYYYVMTIRHHLTESSRAA